MSVNTMLTENGLLSENSSNDARVLHLPEGSIKFTPEEVDLFYRLFIIVDSDEDGEIQVNQGSAFLRRSKLDVNTLKEIWKWSFGGVSKPRLRLGEWFVALKLVAVAQQTDGVITSRDPLFHGLEVNLPEFYFVPNPPDYSVDSSPSLPADTCKVSVHSPSIQGSGFSKFVEYTVSTTTTLNQFYNHTMKCKRRYSDFSWLHGRLKRSFPNTAIPPIPGKKYIGNLDSAFIEERRMCLSQFLVHVIRHPKLGQSFDVQVMLDATLNGLTEYKLITFSAEKQISTAEKALKKASEAAKKGSVSAQQAANATSEWLFYDAPTTETENSNHHVNSQQEIDYLSSQVQNDEQGSNVPSLLSADKLKLFNRLVKLQKVALGEIVNGLERVINSERTLGREVMLLGIQLMQLAKVESVHLLNCNKVVSIALGLSNTLDPMADPPLDDAATSLDGNKPKPPSRNRTLSQQSQHSLDQSLFDRFASIEKAGSGLDIVAKSKLESCTLINEDFKAPLLYMFGQNKAMRKLIRKYEEKQTELESSLKELTHRKKKFAETSVGAAAADVNKVESARKKRDVAQVVYNEVYAQLSQMAAGTTAEFNKYEQERLRELHRLATLYVQHNIKQAQEQVSLLQNLAVATRDEYNSPLQTGDIHTNRVRPLQSYYRTRSIVQQKMSSKFKSALDNQPIMPTMNDV